MLQGKIYLGFMFVCVGGWVRNQDKYISPRESLSAQLVHELNDQGCAI